MRNHRSREMRISHVGVAVKNLKEAAGFLEKAFDLKPVKQVETTKMKAAFVPVGDGEIELIEPLDPNIPIAKFIEEKGEGIHHLSIQVKNIDEVIGELKAKGFKLIDEKPRIGLHDVKIAFLDAQSTNGILIELCEEP